VPDASYRLLGFAGILEGRAKADVTDDIASARFGTGSFLGLRISRFDLICPLAILSASDAFSVALPHRTDRMRPTGTHRHTRLLSSTIRSHGSMIVLIR
jgi:hypothetical protein